MDSDSWISQGALVERVFRSGHSPVYVGSIDGACQAFYTLDELCEWFQSKGLDPDDPAWDYMDQLNLEEIEAEGAES